MSHTDESDINTTWGQWATFGSPAQPVLEDPGVEVVLGVLRESEIG